MRSPLLDLPGAVAADGIDADVAAHYGSLYGEQRTLEEGSGFVDLSHRDVIRLTGPDRLTWLHNLTSQHFNVLAPKTWTGALILSPQGHVEHAFYGVDDGEAFTAHTEPGQAVALIEFLERMKFMTRVEIADVTAEVAVTWRPRPAVERTQSSVERAGSSVERARSSVERAQSSVERAQSSVEPVETNPYANYELVPRDQLATYAEAAGPACGFWAFEALRIARGEPRLGLDTDHRTIPNEAGWIPSAVHLDKGCYRGQETVARVHTLGRPPRRLTLLHLDGSENRLPARGADVLLGEKAVGFVGTSARHHELGPIALAMLKRNVAVDAQLEVDGLPAAQEVIVDPEVGLHVRPLR
jgi:tRNA-modifying protein YgfZ